MAYENLFHKEIGDRVYLISSDVSGPNEDGRSMLPGTATPNSYLVVGEKKALLFDLAVDEPGMKEYAEALAGIPMMTVISHGHYDHIYHAERYREIWLHAADRKLLEGGGVGLRKVEPCPVLHDLVGGDTIDLGGRVLDVIHIPGHTPGSILLLDRNSRILLSGDTGARRLLYGVTGLVPTAQFCVSLQELKKREFDVMYSAHDRCAIPKTHIDLMLDAIQKDIANPYKIVDYPGVGELRLILRGVETDVEYFDMCYIGGQE